MAESGSGDAGALAVGLRRQATGLGLRALAAKALHVAAAAPERMTDIYDNAAAGWLSGPVFAPRLRTEDPLPISKAFWTAFWKLVNLPPANRDKVLATRTLALARHLDPRINQRMAAAALQFPGVAEAAAGGIPEPFDLDRLTESSPASLAYALCQEVRRPGGLTEPFGMTLVPHLRPMPAPLDYINIQVVQSLTLMGLVAGYRAVPLDQLAMSGFLMGQVGHHYSALLVSVVLTTLAMERPEGLELALDSIFKGWKHGRETPLLMGAPWETLWHLPVDQVRAELGVKPFESPFIAAVRQWRNDPRNH